MATSTTTKLALGFTVAVVIVIGAWLLAWTRILGVLAALSALPTPKGVRMERKSKQRTLDAIRKADRDNKQRERARKVESERPYRHRVCRASNRADWEAYVFQSLFASPEVCRDFSAYCEGILDAGAVKEHKGI